MNIKMTLALLLLVGGGIVLWWWDGPQLPPAFDPAAPLAPAQDKGTRALLRKFQPDKIARIEVKTPSGHTILRKVNGEWSLPGNWPVRESEVKALVDLLTSLHSRFEPEPITGQKELEKKGLAPPSLTVELTVDGGEYTLAFGEEGEDSGTSRFSRDTYLRVGKTEDQKLVEKPEVVRLAPGLIALLDRPEEYYRQRRLFTSKRVAGQDKEIGKPKERLNAKSIEVRDFAPKDAAKKDGLHYTLADVDGQWELSKPVRDRLDEPTRDTLMAAVLDIWVERFLSSGPTAAAAAVAAAPGDLASLTTALFWLSPQGMLVKAGLSQPERSLTIVQQKGKPLTLQIGAVSSVQVKRVPRQQPQLMPGMDPGEQTIFQENRYAKLEGNAQIFEIKADKLKDVFVALDALRDSRVARFNSGDARKVEIQHGGEDIVLEKDKDKWKIVKPMSAVADSGKVTDLLTKLADLQARDKDVIDKDDPKKYGFDKPEAVVKVTLEEENKGGEIKEKKTRTLTVRVGKHDADKKKLYVMADDWPRINAVDDSLEALVQRPALAYRGKQMFDFNAADAARLDIDNRGKKITLEHDKDAWRLTYPVKAEADASKVDQLLGDLGHLEAAEFLAQAPKKDELGPQYGLDKPALTVRVEFTDKKKPAQVLHVGKAVSGKGEYFARVADGGPVFALNEQLHKQLARDSLSYRPQTLWQLLPEEIVSLRVSQAGQKEYVLTRSDNNWKISGPFEADVRGDAVRKMTANLVSPKVESYTVHEAKNLAEYGLDKPALTVHIKTVLDKDDKEHTLSIGKSAKEGGAHYAKRASDTAIFTVGDALVRAADRPALDLLDTKLLRLDPGQVARLHSQAGDKSLTLEKKADAWRATESPAGAFPADTEATASLSQLCSNLPAQRFAAYGKGVEWAKYGLDKPAFRIAVAADKVEHVIELGKPVENEPGACYARVDKGAGAAVLAPETTRLLKRDYLAYVQRGLLKFDSEAATALQRRMGTNVLEIVHSQPAAGNEGSGWEVVKPAKEKADEQAMRQLFDQLGNLRAERIAAYPVEELKSFGLETPSAVVTIKLKGERKPSEHTIKLGKTAPPLSSPGTGGDKGRGERFALVDDGKVVAVLSGSLAEQLSAAPLAFRDRTIAHFAAADRLQLERGPRRAVFSKVDGSWKLTEPLRSEAEQDQLDDFIGRLEQLRADALVVDLKDPADLKKYGLDRPEAQWLVQSGNKDMLNLLIGNKEPKSERRYARLAKSGLVFLLDPRLSQKVLDEYRPRTVWTPPLDAVEIESLNYRYRRNPFLLEKRSDAERGNEGAAWQAVDKADAKINAATVEDTLASLAGLKLSRYAVDKGANLALFGLDKPELILEAATRSGKRALQIGNVEGSSKGRYARLADSERGDVFVLDEETCARLLRDLNAFGKPPPRSTVQPAAR
ncbi:MAG: DUF4340 domain-containing protein [Gemmataceae bacterium]